MNRRAISDNKQRSAHEEHKMPFYPESKGEGLIDLKTREEHGEINVSKWPSWEEIRSMRHGVEEEDGLDCKVM